MTSSANSWLPQLEHCVRTHPVIDHHAHNIYRSGPLSSEDLLAVTTEAADEALSDTCTSLPHLRARKQLCTLYGSAVGSGWETVKRRRKELLEENADALTRRCLDNSYTIFLDDLYDDAEVLESFEWHSKFTQTPCRRLIRIEEMAADILSSLHDQQRIPQGAQIEDEEACSLAWTKFLANFEAAITDSLESPEVAGFKSAICFTVGLDVTVDTISEVSQAGSRSFQREFLPTCVENEFSIEAQDMNSELIVRTCKLIAAAHDQGQRAKPLQFHTGIGNKEIPVLKSDPAYLQPLIMAFPAVPIILLHAAYPYTRTAGYLAMVFKNVFLDMSAVFPEVSRDGQERTLRECLEMTLWRKLLWSTDGHWFPETFYLANKQFREALLKVLKDYVQQDDLNEGEAIQTAKGILFDNANRIYQLELQSGYGPPGKPKTT